MESIADIISCGGWIPKNFWPTIRIAVLFAGSRSIKPAHVWVSSWNSAAASCWHVSIIRALKSVYRESVSTSERNVARKLTASLRFSTARNCSTARHASPSRFKAPQPEFINAAASSSGTSPSTWCFTPTSTSSPAAHDDAPSSAWIRGSPRVYAPISLTSADQLRAAFKKRTRSTTGGSPSGSVEPAIARSISMIAAMLVS
mmetsp:Transcript_24109/g.49878  ORF Transcript_24109/g.49878 Transcript_24109/m.49878 type:complete len:202 (-) Transcript_24109:390-995(-)